MSTITMATRQLIELLSTLAHTSSTEPELHHAGVLLHGARGRGYGPESGVTDVLVGTSTTTSEIGHYIAATGGQLHRPVLWSIDDVEAVIAAFRPKVRADKLAEVTLTVSGREVVVAEAGQLDLGCHDLKVTFTEKNLDEYPRGLWQLLSDVLINPYVADREGRELPVAARTDFAPSALGPFLKVAKTLGAPIELYRWHQHKHILVQIGHAYRGLLMPTRWDDADTPGEGLAPDAEIYPPKLPPVPPKQDTKVGILHVGNVEVHLSKTDVPLTDFPPVDPDPALLCAAAETVVTTQFGSATELGKKLKVSFRKASDLLEQLEGFGVVGAPRGSRSREVLITSEGLDIALESIRATAALNAAPTPEEGTGDDES